MKTILHIIFYGLIGCSPHANAQSTNTLTFNYTGEVQKFKVPDGVTSIEVEMLAGGGGKSIWENEQYDYYEPGKGGKLTAIYPVKEGETIFVFVGGKGGDAVKDIPGTGGFNGGGNGATSGMVYGPYTGGGGGGASDIRIGGTELKHRVLVVGGAGGAGSNHPETGGDNGGHGGDLIATNGMAGFISTDESVGRGGSQENGGKGGLWEGYTRATNGSLGQGGNAPAETGGGGGGAGFYGGGGGCWSGGGGGSSFANSNAINVLHEQGVNEANGMVIITFNTGYVPVDCDKVKVTATTTKGSICEGETIRLIGHNCDSYSWDNDVVDNVPFEPRYGSTTFVVTGTSFGGRCISTDTITIIVNDMDLDATITYNEVTGLGIADIEVTGYGTAPYSYNWNDKKQSDVGHFTDLKTGGYQVEVTDAIGCKGTQNVKILQKEPLNINANTDTAINNQNYLLTAHTNEDQSFVTVSYRGAFEFQIVDKNDNVVRNGHAIDSKIVDISKIPAGTYKVQLIFKEVKEEVTFVKY